MSKESVAERVIAVVSEQLGVAVGDIKPESRLVDDLKADSLDTVELVMAVENEFEVKIPDEEAEQLLTVQAIIDKVIEKKPKLAWKKVFVKNSPHAGDFSLKNFT